MDITTALQLDMTEVRQLIAKVLGLPSENVYDANSEQDLSNISAFITVNLSFSQSFGYERKHQEETETISTAKNSTVSVNAYGINAYLIIEKLITSLKTSFVKKELRKLGFSIISTSQIRNLTGVISNAKEERAQVDLIINHVHSVSSHVDVGDSVTLQLQTEK